MCVKSWEYTIRSINIEIMQSVEIKYTVVESIKELTFRGSNKCIFCALILKGSLLVTFQKLLLDYSCQAYSHVTFYLCILLEQIAASKLNIIYLFAIHYKFLLTTHFDSFTSFPSQHWVSKRVDKSNLWLIENKYVNL